MLARIYVYVLSTEPSRDAWDAESTVQCTSWLEYRTSNHAGHCTDAVSVHSDNYFPPIVIHQHLSSTMSLTWGFLRFWNVSECLLSTTSDIALLTTSADSARSMSGTNTHSVTLRKKLCVNPAVWDSTYNYKQKRLRHDCHVCRF